MSNRLTVLAADIRATHAAIVKASVEMAERVISVGNMLIEAKAALPHGRWDAWLRDQASLSPRTARRYMQIARSNLKTATVADLGVGGAARALARATQPNVSNPDSDPAYVAWRDDMMAEIGKAPSQAARDELLRVMREQVEAERYAAFLLERMPPDDLGKVCCWLERTDPKEIIRQLKAGMRKGAAA